MKFVFVCMFLLVSVIIASHEPDHKGNSGDRPEQRDFPQKDDPTRPTDFTRNDDLDEK